VNNIIKKIVEIASKKKEGHIPSSLSILDILYVLYDRILNLEQIKNDSVDRDRFILSKGHASLGLYTILDHFKILDENLYNFCDFNSKLGGHPTDKITGVEASTGSLGHGLPIGVGMALSYKIQGFKNKIYVLIGDGEANEGTIWESSLLASHHNLNNLICIVDFNHSTDRALELGDLKNKFESFGWYVSEIDGHNQNEIYNSLKNQNNKPTCIIANTIKGKGISFMENNPEWHHKFPTEQEINQLLENL
jgi:transketolase